jgi:hypothetical protein
MTCHSVHAPPGFSLRLRDTNYSYSGRSHGHEPPGQLPKTTEQLVTLGWPVCNNPYRDVDDLIPAIVQERPGYMFFLERLGFNHDTSISILRYWVTLKLKAPAGGPYDLFGTALAVIAELDEPRTQTCHDCINVREAPEKPCKLDWFLAFAHILNDRALSSFRRVGIHRSQNFSQVKRMVYHMMLAVGNEGWQ